MTTKYTIGQEVEICGLPDYSADYDLNGVRGLVIALPGHDKKFPRAYLLRLKDGKTQLAIGKYVRNIPYVTPSKRPQRNEVVSWEQFDARTGLDSNNFRDGFRPAN